MMVTAEKNSNAKTVDTATEDVTRVSPCSPKSENREKNNEHLLSFSRINVDSQVAVVATEVAAVVDTVVGLVVELAGTE